MSARVDAAYVAYLTRENAWLRARVADLTTQLAASNALAARLLEDAARSATDPDDEEAS